MAISCVVSGIFCFVPVVSSHNIKMAALIKKCQIYLDEYKKAHSCKFFVYQAIAGLLCATVIILGVAALFAAGICESLTEFHLATTSTSFLGLKNIVIINRSPHGEITMTAASSGFNGGDSLKIESKLRGK